MESNPCHVQTMTPETIPVRPFRILHYLVRSGEPGSAKSPDPAGTGCAPTDAACIFQIPRNDVAAALRRHRALHLKARQGRKKVAPDVSPGTWQPSNISMSPARAAETLTLARNSLPPLAGLIVLVGSSSTASAVGHLLAALRAS